MRIFKSAKPNKQDIRNYTLSDKRVKNIGLLRPASRTCSPYNDAFCKQQLNKLLSSQANIVVSRHCELQGMKQKTIQKIPSGCTLTMTFL